MGRKSNAKWASRSWKYRYVTLIERLRLGKLFGGHRKFNP